MAAWQALFGWLCGLTGWKCVGAGGIYVPTVCIVLTMQFSAKK